jgi:hypothetical protein
VSSDVEEKKTAGKLNDEILRDHRNNGIDRRGFLMCMAWAGTGALCVMTGGVPRSYSLRGYRNWSRRPWLGFLSGVNGQWN